MLKTKPTEEEQLEEQLEALLAHDPLLLVPAMTRRMLDKTPPTDGEHIEQHIYSLFIYLYRLKCEPGLEDEWRLGLEQHYSKELAVLTRDLVRREERNRLAQRETEQS